MSKKVWKWSILTLIIVLIGAVVTYVNLDRIKHTNPPARKVPAASEVPSSAKRAAAVNTAAALTVSMYPHAIADAVAEAKSINTSADPSAVKRARLVVTYGAIYTMGGYFPQPTTGIWAKTALTHYLTIPYYHHQVIIQPQTVRNVWNQYGLNGPAYFTAAGTALSLICGLGGPELAAMCATFVVLQSSYLYTAFHNATAYGACVRIQWDTPLGVDLPLLRLKTGVYGQAETWIAGKIYYNDPAKTIRYGYIWGNVNRCGVRNALTRANCQMMISNPYLDLQNVCWIYNPNVA